MNVERRWCSSWVAVIGTTVAPWQLFFQQSNIVDKRITPRHINFHERVRHGPRGVRHRDLGQYLHAHPRRQRRRSCGTTFYGHYQGGGAVSSGLAETIGHGSGVIFAIILLNASIIGAAAVTLATSYAFGDVFGMRSSLDRSFKEAKAFYALFSAIVVIAAAIVLIPHAPLGLITESVQALAGVLLPRRPSLPCCSATTRSCSGRGSTLRGSTRWPLSSSRCSWRSR